MSLELKNITKKFDDETIFENFNLSLETNKISCILGSSGSGKTTLLNIIANLTSFEGECLTNLKNISYIFQEPRLIDTMTVFDNMDFALCSIYPNKHQRYEIIEKFLSLVEMWESRKKYPKELSGGMAQRVSMARAFAYPSQILLMDEAFKGLDISLKNRLIKTFLKLWTEDKRTVVFVTHDIYEALHLADRIYLLANKPAEIVLSEDIGIDKLKRELSNPELTLIRDKIIDKMLG